MATREEISTALFDLIKTAYAFKVSSRRVKDFTNVRSSDQPAFYLMEFPERHERMSELHPARRIFQYEAWIFISTGLDPNTTPISTINNLIDLIDPVVGGVLKPQPTSGKQTLDGRVYDCYIEGEIAKSPGDLDGTGIVCIPIKVISN